MPRQGQVPGTEREYHPEITQAAEDFVEVRDERKELAEVEAEKNETLVQVMRRHGLTEYVDEEAGLYVTIPPKEPKAKVAKLKTKEAESDDE